MTDQELILAMVGNKLQNLGFRLKASMSHFSGKLAEGTWLKDDDNLPPWQRMTVLVTIAIEIGNDKNYILELKKKQEGQIGANTENFDYHDPRILDLIEEWVKPYDRGRQDLCHFGRRGPHRGSRLDQRSQGR